MMKLVEQVAGVGDLSLKGAVIRQVRYNISRYQGMRGETGLPIPGLHRIEGSIDVTSPEETAGLVGEPLVLRLEDGRALGIRLADAEGRVLSEGHGPTKCLCC
jgi:hypothetical protein